MLSNDKNIESIAQLIEELKKYALLKGEYFRLTIVEKTVRLLTAIALTLVLTTLLILALIYVSFAIAFAIGSAIGMVWGFIIVGGVYVMFFLLCIMFRRTWIQRPLIRFLASLLME